MFLFGSGVLLATPQGLTPYGTTLNTTPINVGLINEVSLDISASTKQLYGQQAYPLAVGIGTRKLTGKAKMARISGQALGTLFFGYQPSVGETLTSYAQSGSIPTTPFQITPTVPSSGTWARDMGVVYAATGLPLQQVASGPTTGQYSVSAGVYTFASADTGLSVLISYQYTVTATTTRTFTVSNPTIGPNLPFSLNLFAQDPTTNAQFSMYLYNVVASKLSMGFKLEDFMMPELDFEVYANAAGQVMQLNFADAA
jgi:hypothetical protein